MLYGLLVTLFVFLCFLLVLVILIQKGKSSMGLGGLGGSSQMLFGGSGGQDMFQKITWVMVSLFMAGSLVIALMKTSGDQLLSYNIRPKGVNTMPQMPSTPAPDANKAAAPVESAQPMAAEQPAQSGAVAEPVQSIPNDQTAGHTN